LAKGALANITRQAFKQLDEQQYFKEEGDAKVKI
jgi:hypothetical protein